MTALRILHVTECYGGGVGRAVDNVTRLLPDAEHHLLWRGDADPRPLGFASLHDLPWFLPGAVARVRSAVRKLRPDVVYAHSSWAGVFTRATKLPVPVIYQPHCYKFDDLEQKAFARRMFITAERALISRTARTVVLSPHEDLLAKSLAPSSHTHYVPNGATLTPNETANETGFAVGETVVMNGRISPQKDPEFFANVARSVARKAPHLRFRWIGDGDKVLREALESAGVHVTGWLSSQELAIELSRPALYFHSARYEGFPLSILDAAIFEHPIAVRSIPAFEGMPLPSAHTVAESADLITAIFSDGAALRAARDAAVHLNDTTSTRHQRDALTSLFAPFH